MREMIQSCRLQEDGAQPYAENLDDDEEEEEEDDVSDSRPALSIGFPFLPFLLP